MSSAESLSSLPPEFDATAMRARYEQERDKRLREDGNEQYIEIAGRFSHYLDDPYVDAVVNREPLTDEVDVIVIGGGFGAALDLLRPGVEEGLTERAYGRVASDYRILAAELGPDAGWIGAARAGYLRAQENAD